MLKHTLSVAPMMGCTDRHARHFLRSFSPDALLYTEMVTALAILFTKDRQALIGFSDTEQPVALQIGGSKPTELAEASRIGEQFGYQEINLNVGCPSNRVQKGHIGACLMKQPELVRDCVATMATAVEVPITIKCRLGVDEHNDYEFIEHFIDITRAVCTKFIIHARIALLDGLSPKKNLTVPPLRHEDVYRLKKQFPELTIIINGGIHTATEASRHLRFTDGVMIGREAYRNPYILALMQQAFVTPSQPLPDRVQLLYDCLPYIEQQLAQGVGLGHMSRHLLGWFHNCPNSRLYRRHISQNAHLPSANIQTLKQALQLVQTTEAA